MKYKVGELVLIKEWEDMIEEYGVDEYEDIATKFGFTNGMKKYCGKVMLIENVLNDSYHFVNGCGYLWSDEMIYARVKPQDLELFHINELGFVPDEYKSGLGVPVSFDDVNKPKHYADKEIEVIDYIRDTTKFLEVNGYEGYCVGNVLKYISRYTKKGNPEQDLKKALYYLNEVIKERGGKQ